MPTRAATRATAGSPSVCIIRVKPVGAKTSGSAAGRPRIVVEVSTDGDVLQHLRDGTRRGRKTSRERRRLISSPAAPSV